MGRESQFIVALLAFAAGLAVGCGPSATSDRDPGGGGGGGGSDCPTGFASCDGDPATGCETDLSTLTDCGSCGNACAAVNGSPSCVSGSCVMNCNAGFGNCDADGATGCESTLDTATHCGGCYHSCNAANASGECVQGGCVMSCTSGYADCNMDMTDGCESDLTQASSCGSCDVGCTAGCAAGTCETCDSGLMMASDDPFDAAKAIGLCGGVLDARWALPDGSAPPQSAIGNFRLGHGILSGFGPNVSAREGSNLLALSSGSARRPNDSGYRNPSGFDKGYASGHPEGFPKESPSCPGVVTGVARDGIALELELAVPDWAQGFAFDFNFYTYEWPEYVCSQYNDFFIALLEPYPAGQDDGNISFDAQGNPVSVNNALLSTCGCLFGPPCSAGGKSFACANGTSELQGTGFQGDFFSSRAATGWLTTSAPVEPGSVVTLKLMIYDSGDGVLDSTVLIDNFRWIPAPTDVVTEPIL